MVVFANFLANTGLGQRRKLREEITVPIDIHPTFYCAENNEQLNI
jgi:hypothetical protein